MLLRAGRCFPAQPPKHRFARSGERILCLCCAPNGDTPCGCWQPLGEAPLSNPGTYLGVRTNRRLRPCLVPCHVDCLSCRNPRSIHLFASSPRPRECRFSVFACLTLLWQRGPDQPLPASPSPEGPQPLEPSLGQPQQTQEPPLNSGGSWVITFDGGVGSSISPSWRVCLWSQPSWEGPSRWPSWPSWPALFRRRAAHR